MQDAEEEFTFLGIEGPGGMTGLAELQVGEGLGEAETLGGREGAGGAELIRLQPAFADWGGFERALMEDNAVQCFPHGIGQGRVPGGLGGPDGGEFRLQHVSGGVEGIGGEFAAAGEADADAGMAEVAGGKPTADGEVAGAGKFGGSVGSGILNEAGFVVAAVCFAVGLEAAMLVEVEDGATEFGG